MKNKKPLTVYEALWILLATTAFALGCIVATTITHFYPQLVAWLFLSPIR